MSAEDNSRHRDRYWTFSAIIVQHNILLQYGFLDGDGNPSELPVGSVPFRNDAVVPVWTWLRYPL